MVKVPVPVSRAVPGMMALLALDPHPDRELCDQAEHQECPDANECGGKGTHRDFLKSGADRSAQGPAAILFPLSIPGKFRSMEESGARSCPQEQYSGPPVGRSFSKETNNGDERKRDRSK